MSFFWSLMVSCLVFAENLFFFKLSVKKSEQLYLIQSVSSKCTQIFVPVLAMTLYSSIPSVHTCVFMGRVVCYDSVLGLFCHNLF
jgi:hypothetical protein